MVATLVTNFGKVASLLIFYCQYETSLLVIGATNYKSLNFCQRSFHDRSLKLSKVIDYDQGKQPNAEPELASSRICFFSSSLESGQLMKNNAFFKFMAGKYNILEKYIFSTLHGATFVK